MAPKKKQWTQKTLYYRLFGKNHCQLQDIFKNGFHKNFIKNKLRKDNGADDGQKRNIIFQKSTQY